MKEFCPACKIETEFDISGSSAYCNQCGRTQSAAESARIELERRNRAKFFRKFLIIFGSTVVAILVLFGFLVEPGIVTDAMFRGLVKATGLFLFFGAIAWVIKKILK